MQVVRGEQATEKNVSTFNVHSHEWDNAFEREL